MNKRHPFLDQLADPPLVYEAEAFELRIATTEEELLQAFKLRYEVFNVEQAKGLDTANDIGIDMDHFDDSCIHLLAIQKSDQRVIGTYRVHPGLVARATGKGFYSSTEFKIDGLEPITDSLMELGRSCVHPDFRSGAVVSLLWSGIAILTNRSKLPYLMGCVSMEVDDPAAGWALHEHFKAEGCMCERLHASPMPGYELEKADPERVREILESRAKLMAIYPPLLKGYIRLGAWICGEPVYDFEFKTIDFLILLDVTIMPEKYAKHYMPFAANTK